MSADRFSETLSSWADVMLQINTGDVWPSMSCSEIESICDVLRAIGRDDVVTVILDIHKTADEPGDMHYVPTWEECEDADDISAMMQAHEDRFAALGRAAATLLGSTLDWDSDTTQALAETADQILGKEFPSVGEEDSLRYWSIYATVFGWEGDYEEESDDDDEEDES